MAVTIRKITKQQVWEIRHQVMWPDKDLDYIKLKEDDSAEHFGLFAQGRLISIISLFIQNNDCQFKFATIQQEQGKGYGSKLLNYVIKEAKLEGVNKIWCNARENKINFYKKFGLHETNNRFVKGDRNYVIMEMKCN